MQLTFEILRQTGVAALGLLQQPFYYIAVLLMVLQFLRQTRTERKLFHVRLHVWPLLLLRAMLLGLAVGACVSLLSFGLGAAVTMQTIYWLWAVAGILVLFRVRYLCFAYSAGIIGILHSVAGWLEPQALGKAAAPFVESLQSLDIPGLLILIALLHLAEAWLVRLQSTELASPLFLAGKRGKLIGGYQLQGYWPIPLLLLVPAQAGTGADAILPWAPLLGGTALAGSWTMLGVPMVVGFSELTRSLLPEQRARQTAKALLYYSLILGAVAAVAAWWPPLTLVAALCALLLHEAIGWISAAAEQKRSPYYVHSDQGLRVLAVVPGSPAEALGIVPGEIIYKVNGYTTQTPDVFHRALHVNSAFCKLEVINHEGHSKFLQRARFAGEHHQLGIILAPDESSGYYAAAKPASLIELFARKPAAKSRDTTSSM
ncbi:PDZ domain-containing protein [Paenibacillus sp. MAHUQ-46]|uniref:PDZ domain-containing protein n=2 Tax=Paenibacillus TaxID=44249 RepID=A0A934J5X9_9BACL|nr:PDZ domain-containing protein [Paenibacillus roseus]